MRRVALTRLLGAPLISGWVALGLALVAVGLPTSIRWMVQGAVTGCEFTPYLPFVLLCAILSRWWTAMGVALASVAIMGGVFGGASRFGLSCFVDSAAIFLASSSATIGISVLVRLAVVRLQKGGADDSSGGVIFSLEEGKVWASWYGQDAPMLLGSQAKVSEMMQDYLKQEKLGKRLNAR